MTAASSADATVRRPVAPRQPAAPVARTAPAATRSFDHDEDEFRLNLSDIPRIRESMDVEGLKPTLLSKLFDLVAPLKA